MFDILDLILVIAVIIFAVSGYRQGFVVGALSFIGFLGGGVLGAHIATPFAEMINAESQGPIVGILVVLGLALIGQIAATALGAALRDRLTWRPGQTVDAVAGAVLSGISVLLVAWLLATAVDRSPFTTLAEHVRRSEVLRTVDAAMPNTVRDAFADLRRLVDQNGFPEVFAGLGGGQIVPIEPPDTTADNTQAVQTAAASILKIRGIAPSCSKRVEGTGFVYATERVMTNAHVVAGVTRPQVEVGNSTLPARVVLFDPDTDIAVLYVPGLRQTPLSFQNDPPGRTGDDAIVAGYPQDGPYTTAPARIRNRQTARAPNIYSQGTVLRDIYAVRGQVLPGNSGGPLLSEQGTVYGVVFAAATNDSDTGYVLTSAEVDDLAAAGQATSTAVSTRSCD
ncbi:MarP family serine protease [Candidatus Protofrankia datiscae]|uniref:Colicin V production protein n=2 Tax=Protofrankia TaxID=2994361 RepID=F8AYK0_9ACTN|nr:MarP family serine protease [Candidatus Protofrankia datiscae]AEH11568.1 Colicin V production protein [Candidatus Protofrankia datiscae]